MVHPHLLPKISLIDPTGNDNDNNRRIINVKQTIWAVKSTPDNGCAFHWPEGAFARNPCTKPHSVPDCSSCSLSAALAYFLGVVQTSHNTHKAGSVSNA
eukprot:1159420-Pelagomonas_calceolata.AAC.13